MIVSSVAGSHQVGRHEKEANVVDYKRLQIGIMRISGVCILTLKIEHGNIASHTKRILSMASQQAGLNTTGKRNRGPKTSKKKRGTKLQELVKKREELQQQLQDVRQNGKKELVELEGVIEVQKRELGIIPHPQELDPPQVESDGAMSDLGAEPDKAADTER